MATQHEREQLVTALLDITLGEFLTKLQTMNDTDLGAIDEDVNQYAGDYMTHLRAADRGVPGASQLLVQAIASMSDDTLHEVVRTFGKDPL